MQEKSNFISMNKTTQGRQRIRVFLLTNGDFLLLTAQRCSFHCSQLLFVIQTQSLCGLRACKWGCTSDISPAMVQTSVVEASYLRDQIPNNLLVFVVNTGPSPICFKCIHLILTTYLEGKQLLSLVYILRERHSTCPGHRAGHQCFEPSLIP